MTPGPVETTPEATAKDLPEDCTAYLGPAGTRVLSVTELLPSTDADPDEPGLEHVQTCEWLAGDVTAAAVLIFTGDPPAAQEFLEKAESAAQGTFECENQQTASDWECELEYETKYYENIVPSTWTIKYKDGYLLSVHTTNLEHDPVRDDFIGTVFG